MSYFDSINQHSGNMVFFLSSNSMTSNKRFYVSSSKIILFLDYAS